ncbi:MAG: nucleotidyl transferase AbiEii/AbiGii toxin family protein [Firmicutes bacterium]|nr:nucleotidyl transferase AbiEii/AbiGii toxin family protein [Bacillota bacterium]
MTNDVKNMAASVHQRLLNKAKQASLPFNELLQRFAVERFLYRLSRSHHADRFILKGALMFYVWRPAASRPTKDIDVLARMDNNIEAIVTAIKDACLQDVIADGMSFHAETVTAARIARDAEYQGVRVRLRTNLGNARLSLQIDIGFGDVVTPAPCRIVYPAILDFPPPELNGYSMESTIAEKFQAMVELGVLNSRMKDFYDVWLLSQKYAFKGEPLSAAIEKTFRNRGTRVLAEPSAFKDSLADDPYKATQWRAFVRKSRLNDAPETFREVAAILRTFLGPITAALAGNRPFRGSWVAPGPWIAPPE